MTTKHMYQHPLMQDLKGYFITKQLAYTNVRSGPAKNHLTPICVYSEINTCYIYVDMIYGSSYAR